MSFFGLTFMGYQDPFRDRKLELPKYEVPGKETIQEHFIEKQSSSWDSPVVIVHLRTKVLTVIPSSWNPGNGSALRKAVDL